jgi:hypothetical protein
MAAVKFLKLSSGAFSQNATTDDLSFQSLALSTTLGVTGAATLGSVVTTGIDAGTATTMSIGGTNATTVTIGRTGQLVQFAGNVNIAGIETVVGGTTWGATVNFGPSGTATVGTQAFESIQAQFQYSYWNGSAAITTNGFALRSTPQSAAAAVGDLIFVDAGTTARMKLVAGTGKLLIAGGIDLLAAGALAIGATTATSVVITPNTTHSGTTTSTGLLTASNGLTMTTGAAAITANAASSLTTSAGALTLTSAVAATWSTAAGVLTLNGVGGMAFQGNSVAVMSIDAAGAGLLFAANKGVTATAGTGAFDFSGGSGIFKTSTGAATIGPGAVTVSGAATFTAAGTALTVNNNATITGTLGAGATTVASLITTTNGAITANGSGNISSTTGNITTGGYLAGVSASGSTAMSTPNLQASGYGNVAASAVADLSIGTDNTRTRNVTIGNSGSTVTINGTISGAVTAATSVVIPGFTADTAGVTAKDPLYVSANDKVLKAVATSYAAADVIGFASNTAASAAAVGVMTQGILTAVLTSATFGAQVYLSPTGTLTTTAPSTAGQVVIPVGTAKNATDMIICIGTPLLLS